MFSLNSFRNTPYDRQFAFAGSMYEWNYNSTFIPGKTNYQIKTPPIKIIHFIERNILTSSTALTFRFIENSIISVQGTSVLSGFNVNRTVNSTSQLKIFTNPSATSGSIIENILLVSGSPFCQQSPEVILASDTDYIMELNNSGAVNATVNLAFVWYESNN